MRLNINQPKLKSSILSFIRSVDKELTDKVIAAKVDKVDSLIVLGDGYEDARVVSLICHHLDGKKVVDVIKPELTRFNAVKVLKEYGYIKRYGHLVFVIDQEADNLDKLYRDFKTTLNDVGIKFEESEKFSIPRLVSCDCSLGDHVFKLVVVVNGLDDVGGPSHRIEDHLVRMAGVAGQGDSKDVWRGLSDGERLGVFRKIYGDKDSAVEVFRQHFDGLGLLDC